MDTRFLPVCLLVALVFLAAAGGCMAASGLTPEESPARIGTTGTPAVVLTKQPVTEENIDRQLASVKSKNPVWCEAYRMFRTMNSTQYIHPPYFVDNYNGVYKFDCLGFVDHVLMSADPDVYRTIGKGVNPSIGSYAAYFGRLDSTSPDSHGWTRVPHPVNLQPGDVCLWLKPGTIDTGHLWIIAGHPEINPKRTDEVLVRIFDSSEAHSDDSRSVCADKTGLGSGILGMAVDGQGNPAGLYWNGAVSTAPGEQNTTIVCGRLNR